MLRSTKDLKEYSISATDGVIGQVRDTLFDDDSLVVRYLVVETGGWLSSRKVLISPFSIHDPNWTDRHLPVSITQDQVRNSPGIDTDKPVSRQDETDILGYYDYPYYWGGAGLWGGGKYPYAMFPGYSADGSEPKSLREADHAFENGQSKRHANDDPHLRSGNAMDGYHILASDGEIGHLTGLLIDEHSWAIRYLIIDTSNWWMGHRVLVAPEWIGEVYWSDRTITVDLQRHSIQHAPGYDSKSELLQNGEWDVHRHLTGSGYWLDDPPTNSP